MTYPLFLGREGHEFCLPFVAHLLRVVPVVRDVTEVVAEVLVWEPAASTACRLGWKHHKSHTALLFKQALKNEGDSQLGWDAVNEVVLTFRI